MEMQQIHHFNQFINRWKHKSMQTRPIISTQKIINFQLISTFNVSNMSSTKNFHQQKLIDNVLDRFWVQSKEENLFRTINLFYGETSIGRCVQYF